MGSKQLLSLNYIETKYITHPSPPSQISFFLLPTLSGYWGDTFSNTFLKSTYFSEKVQFVSYTLFQNHGLHIKKWQNVLITEMCQFVTIHKLMPVTQKIIILFNTVPLGICMSASNDKMICCYSLTKGLIL